jgi:4-carboxymuconolactone decarboxylase
MLPRAKGLRPPIALLGNPELMARLQKVGEFLRFQSSLPSRASEFATLVVARQRTQQFKCFTHVPLALKVRYGNKWNTLLMIFHSPSTLSSVNKSVYLCPVQLSISSRAVATEFAISMLAMRT